MEMGCHFGVVECSGIDCVGHREQTGVGASGGGGREGKDYAWGEQMQTILYRMGQTILYTGWTNDKFPL